MTGVVALALFAGDFWDNWRRGVPGDSLWMCHLANLMMGLGLLTGNPFLLRMGVLWNLLGMPWWLREVLVGQSLSLASYISHFGGLALALWAMRVPCPGSPWLAAWVVFVAVQQLCRWVTPMALNVNVSHAVWEGAQSIFSSYRKYWVVTTLLAGASLFLLNSLLPKMEGEPCDAHD